MANVPKFGEQIREMRKTYGLTQEEYAKKAGIAINSLRRYEANERQPTMDVLEKLASALGLQLQSFLWENPHKKRSSFWFMDLEEKLKQIGYSTGFYEEDAYLWINYPDGTLEVRDEDLKALNDSANAFLRFQLQELRKRNEKDFRSNHMNQDEP